MAPTLGRAAALWIFALLVVAMADAQPGLEEAKRAYFEGRFEESIQSLESLRGVLSDAESRREAAFFLGLSHLALGDEDQGRTSFESAVRHDPEFEPSAELFNPTVVGVYDSVRSTLVGRLLVESTPEGARVRIGARDVGTTPYRGPSLAGEQLVRVTLEGYTPEERTAMVRAGDESRISISMRPRASAPTEEPGPTSASSGGGGMSGKTIGILAGAGGGAALAAVAAGGGGGGTTTGGRTGGVTQSTPPANAAYMISIQPGTIQSEPSGDPGFDWVVRFEVIVVETNGLGGNVDFVNVVLRSSLTGSTTPPVNFGAGDVISNAGTNRIEGGGEIAVPVGVVYNFPQGTSAGTATVDVQVTDDRGNRQRLSASALIR